MWLFWKEANSWFCLFQKALWKVQINIKSLKFGLSGPGFRHNVANKKGYYNLKELITDTFEMWLSCIEGAILFHRLKLINSRSCFASNWYLLIIHRSLSLFRAALPPRKKCRVDALLTMVSQLAIVPPKSLLLIQKIKRLPYVSWETSETPPFDSPHNKKLTSPSASQCPHRRPCSSPRCQSCKRGREDGWLVSKRTQGWKGDSLGDCIHSRHSPLTLQEGRTVWPGHAVGWHGTGI